MRLKLNYVFPALVMGLSVLAAGCGGSGGSGGAAPTAPATTLSGTAAAGAPLIGSVTVKGALGLTKSALIEADGNYTVDVTGLTAPYRLRAQGTVGGRTYKLHSYAVADDLGGTVNITPFTDLIVANAAQQIAESFFDSATTTELDPAELDAQEEALQAKLQKVFDAVGVSSAIDLLNSTFSANHSQLDAALDLVRVEVDTTTNVATITNLIENTSIQDSVLDTTDNTDILTVTDATVITGVVTGTQAIAAIFDNFSASYASGLPTGNTLTTISSYFADDFYNEDNNKGLFLTDITTDPGLIGMLFSGVTVTNLDSTAGTAEVTFSFGSNGMLEYQPETWFVAKNATTGQWQLRGDQRIVETDFSYHCNDYDGNGSWAGSCGINTRFWDNDFTNNGTNNAPVASGTVKIIDGTTSVVKATVYLGTPAGGTAGDVQVYNEQNGNFQGDWREFSAPGVPSPGKIDPAVFAEGDTIEYTLYTGDLDITTDPSSPAVDPATLVTSYTDTVLFVPEVTNAKYPTATAATLTAMSSFTLGSDLTIGWTLADGTRNQEVLLEISDSQGNRLEIWDWNFGTTETSVTFASSQLDATAVATAGLLTTDSSYNLKVRIYAGDEQTGQSHSRDYDVTIPGPAASGGSGSTGGACDTTGITTLAAFETAMDACGTVIPMSASALIGNSFTFVGATNEVTTYTDASNGTFTNDGGTTVIPLTWSIDGRGYLTVNYTLPGVGTFYDVFVAYGTDSTTGGLMVKAFTNENNSVFEEIIIPATGGTGGASLTCGFETQWDSINNQPAVFNSYDDFVTVMTACGGPQALTSVDVSGKTIQDTWTETNGDVYVTNIVFSGASTGTYTETLNGSPNGSGSFNWSVANNLLILEVPGAFLEVTAFTASGQVHYSEDASWTPAASVSITDTTTLDGEIWSGDYTILP